MNRCSKCNNELIAGARFCNICGTPVAGVPTPPPTPTPPVILKRTIQPEVRRVCPPRVDQTVAGSLVPSTGSDTSHTADTPSGSTGDNTPEYELERQAEQEEQQSASDVSPAPVIPNPKTPDTLNPNTLVALTLKTDGEAGEQEKPTPLKDTTAMTDQTKKGEEVPASDPDKTVPLPPPNVRTNRAPGIIRPIVSSASLRQNTPNLPGQTPPNPISPLAPVPNTPPLPAEKSRQTDNAPFARPVNTPAPGSLPQDASRRAGGPQSIPVPSRQPSLPYIPARQQNQNRFNAGAPQTPQSPQPLQPQQTPQTPPPAQALQPRQPSLHGMPNNYLERPHVGANSHNNGANSTAARQELPLFSPESFAYTSKAAQHWRQSWRDLQNAEAGPAEDVSKGQAEVAAPLANRKDSFLRMRAIRSRQNQEGSEKNFGFWVTLFLMICLIGGLAAYIVYSYLPNSSVAVRLAQPPGTSQPTFTVVGQASISQGQSLRAHGNNFGANDPIQFFLDGTQPVLASTGSPLSTQADGHGSFDVTIPVGKDWTVGAHIISATDTRQTSLSADLDIQVNLDSTPVAGSNNPYLAFSLNGQPIDHLSFTAQLGQSAPPAQRITFMNTSQAPLQWTAAASTSHNLNWLTILDNNFAGRLNISEPQTMGISVDPTGLSVTDPKKPYTGQVVFTINGTTQLTLGVQLTIINATPEMVFSPNPLIASAPNGTCQPGATLTFINLGTSVISWAAIPDLKGNIQFVNDKNQLTEHGILLPSGSNGDTAVVNLRCSGVTVGHKYTVHVYVNGANPPFTEIVQIGG